MTNKKNKSLQISISNSSDFDIDQESIERLVSYTCEKFDVSMAQISISVVTDEIISQLHGEYMGDLSVTDVMSFDLSEPDEQENIFDMIVNAEMAKRVSLQRKSEFDSELLLYILHGLLHNLGFDDLEKSEFERMHSTENEIMQQLGYGCVFGETKFEG